MFKKISSSQIRIVTSEDGKTYLFFNEDFLVQGAYYVCSNGLWYQPQNEGYNGSPFYPGVIEQISAKIHDTLLTREITIRTDHAGEWLENSFDIIVYVNP